MKTLVVYYSETGNTEKVAKAVARGSGAELKRIEQVKPEDVKGYDLIFVGTPVHGFSPAKNVVNFLDEIPQMLGKKGAAFCTMHAGGDKNTFKVMKEKLESKGISFVGGFSCPGLSRLVGNFGPRIFKKGRPDEKDLKEAENFGRKISETVKQ